MEEFGWYDEAVDMLKGVYNDTGYHLERTGANVFAYTELERSAVTKDALFEMTILAVLNPEKGELREATLSEAEGFGRDMAVRKGIPVEGLEVSVENPYKHAAALGMSGHRAEL